MIRRLRVTINTDGDYCNNDCGEFSRSKHKCRIFNKNVRKTDTGHLRCIECLDATIHHSIPTDDARKKLLDKYTSAVRAQVRARKSINKRVKKLEAQLLGGFE